ncbi:hypothetical protein FH975_12225 [Nesterenkonia sp. Hz 6-5]|nr:hypothetical protein [Nesterenkonia haasae]
MTSMLTVAGIGHFARPEVFDSIVPPQLGNRRFWTYASGAAELSCAALLAVPATRRAGGLCTAALMVAVYPANIYSVRKFWNNPTARTVALVRLPLQIPLIRTSLKIAKSHQGT